MAKIAAANITVTPVPRHGRRLVEGVKQVYVDLTFGNSALEYTTGGIPLPAVGALGLKEIFFAQVEEHTNGYKYVIDRANHKLMILQTGAATPAGSTNSVTGGTPAGTNSAPAFTGVAQTPEGTVDAGTHVFTGVEKTPAGAVAAPAFSGSALAGHSHTFTGSETAAAPMAQVGATHAPAPTTIRVKLEGN